MDSEKFYFVNVASILTHSNVNVFKASKLNFDSSKLLVTIYISAQLLLRLEMPLDYK